jgi:hypothetical protein
MTTTSDFDRLARGWLAEGPNELSDRVLQSALDEVHATQQRRALGAPWRFLSMNGLSRAAIAALVVVVSAGAIYLVGPRLSGPGVPTNAPTPTPSSSPIPTIAGPAPSGLMDTSTWTPFVSARYGFTIGVPPGWSATPATGTWTLERDGPNWLTTNADVFLAPGRTVRVSAWTVPLGPGQTIEGWADVEAWANNYCPKANEVPCAGIHDRVIPMCIESRDCHPSLIVPFKDDVLFFGSGGILPSGMTVVAVWWGDAASQTAAFGGSIRLLESFLSTMGVVRPVYPDAQDAAATFVATGH